MSSKANLAFFHSQNRGLRTAAPEDDYLHPQANAEVSDDSLTETQYFGICMPEQRIHGLLYCWHHPNLKTVSGGAWVWQGMKTHALQCEIFDWRSFMSDRPLRNDLHSYRLDNGYGVDVVEPLKRHHVTYSDASRGNAFDLEYEAVAPPVVWADGKHFEQTMKVRGSLTLRGKQYEVNGYNVRDRSWGKPRPEAHMNIPPVNWMTGVFGDDLHFMCTATDHPELKPDWLKLYPDYPAERTLMGGWLQKDGELLEIVSCRKRTVRNQSTLFVERIELSLVDSKGGTHEMVGEPLALSPLVAWPNTYIVTALIRWRYAGRTGHGDSQEMQLYDFVRALSQ
ncbi:MAG TPA: hypothetical protein VJS42_00820 [Steroidobacteraceae bacterium]|nr:hypothetical protein [Steroidobacteraceae bacterium]